jgi:hypothetical protein
MKKVLLVLAVTLGLTAVAAPPAYAADPLSEAKRAVTARIDARLVALRAMTEAVNQAKRLTAAHRTELTNLLTATTAGLTALKSEVAAETTVAEVRADASRMIDDYRVYLLVAPKVHLTRALDIEAASIEALRKAYDKLTVAVAAAKQAGKDVGDADAKLADLSKQLDAAGSTIAGKAETLLAIKPGPDAEAIKAAVKPIRESVKSARTSLRTAVADAKAVRAILRSK